MEFTDYYATLGIERAATQDEVKRAYRKLARKYHPDVSKEPNAEARFKEVAEAHEALIDPERRAAYDEIAKRATRGQPFEPPPGWDRGFEYSGRGEHGGDREGAMPRGASEAGFSEFFSSLFGRMHGGTHGSAHGSARRGPPPAAGAWPGEDHHARIDIDLLDAYRGARRTVTLRTPTRDAQGQVTLHERQLEVNVPVGVRGGQHLRLSGQGAAGQGGAPSGDLYLEIRFRPDARFRVDGRDVHVALPLAPWEAVLGASVDAPTPQGDVQLTIAPGSVAGRKLRLKGRGLPGEPPGDLYALLSIVVPKADTSVAQEAWRVLAAANADFNPRIRLES